MNTTINHPFLGMKYLLDGCKLIFAPGIRQFVFIPLLINIFLFIMLFFAMQHYVSVFNSWFGGFLPIWLRWLDTFIWLLFLVSFLLAFIYLFVTVTNIITAPFNSLLAEKVEWYLTGKQSEQRSVINNITDIPRSIGRQVVIVLYYLPRAFLIFILFLIPIVQAGAPVLWFLFTSWWLTLSFVDYPTDNHRISLKRMRAQLKQKRGLSFGFGMSVLIMTMIPILNFMAIPAAVAGATKMWIEQLKFSPIEKE